MNRIIAAAFLLLLWTPASAQRTHGKGYYNMRHEVSGQDTIGVVDMWPVYVFKKPADLRRYNRLVENVKKVYPIAREAGRRLEDMEEEILTFPQRQQKAYIKQMEKDIKKEYEPVLRRMTRSQGKVLIKLIDRETDRTSYEIVKELRGGFRAVFWQGIARIFGANLKDTYDKEGEDKVIEQIILMYEAGLI